MSEKYTRIHRLLRILTLIQGETGWNAKRLAAECETSERNIYRDLTMLQGAGIPFHFCDETNGYRVGREFFLPPVDLTLDESLALIALGEAVGDDEQIPMLAPARRAIQKVRGQLPHKVLDAIGDGIAAVEMKLAASQAGEAVADVYERVRQAIVDRRVLRCSYESQSAVRHPGEAGDSRDGEVFLFKPYRLFYNQRAWYAVGHHGGRGEVRCLKLNRFTACTPTDQPYAIPEDFHLRDHLGNAWRMIRGSKTYDVAVQFDPSFAETISDTHWHATQDIDEHDDGSITFRCTVDGLDEIVWWILSMGPHCKVISPAELADRVKELAEQIVQVYQDDDAAQSPASAKMHA